MGATAFQRRRRELARQQAEAAAGPEPGLEDYTLAELREIAEQQDVDLAGATRKADVIDRIREATSRV